MKQKLKSNVTIMLIWSMCFVGMSWILGAHTTEKYWDHYYVAEFCINFNANSFTIIKYHTWGWSIDSSLINNYRILQLKTMHMRRGHISSGFERRITLNVYYSMQLKFLLCYLLLCRCNNRIKYVIVCSLYPKTPTLLR